VVGETAHCRPEVPAIFAGEDWEARLAEPVVVVEQFPCKAIMSIPTEDRNRRQVGLVLVRLTGGGQVEEIGP
jgi:hypothetical protein